MLIKKSFGYLTIAILSLAALSCGADDVDYKPNLVGSWKVTEYKVDISSNSDEADQKIRKMLALNEDMHAIYTFFDNDTYEIKFPDYPGFEIPVQKGKYILKKNKLTIFRPLGTTVILISEYINFTDNEMSFFKDMTILYGSSAALAHLGIVKYEDVRINEVKVYRTLIKHNEQ